MLRKIKNFKAKHGLLAAIDLVELLIADAKNIKATVRTMKRYKGLIEISIYLRNEFQRENRTVKTAEAKRPIPDKQ